MGQKHTGQACRMIPTVQKLCRVIPTPAHHHPPPIPWDTADHEMGRRTCGSAQACAYTPPHIETQQ
jgi:hypothetical protein